MNELPASGISNSIALPVQGQGYQGYQKYHKFSAYFEVIRDQFITKLTADNLDHHSIADCKGYCEHMISKLDDFEKRIKWNPKGNEQQLASSRQAKEMFEKVLKLLDSPSANTEFVKNVFHATPKDFCDPNSPKLLHPVITKLETDSVEATSDPEIEQIVGHAKVRDLTTNEDLPVSIVSRVMSYGIEKFEARLIDKNGETTKKILGFVKLGICRLDPKSNTNYFPDGSSIIDHTLSWTVYAPYGPADKVYIEYIGSSANTSYKGIGTILMQAAMERGYQFNCKGRIVLDACWNSHGFYNKLGMVNRKGEPVKIENKRDNGSHVMHMAEKGIKAWADRIEASPILNRKLPKIYIKSTSQDD